MTTPPKVGKCYCGCGETANKNRHFAQGHDRQAESYLNDLLYGADSTIASRIVSHGYGPRPKDNSLKEAHDELAKSEKCNRSSSR